MTEPTGGVRTTRPHAWDRASVGMLLALVGGATGGVTWLTVRAAAPLAQLFGGITPPVGTALIGVGGVVLWATWLRPAGFVVFRRGTDLWPRAMGWALGLGCLVSAADAWLRLPQGGSVALPWALVYYPALAVVAEMVFHLVPLVAAVGLSRWNARERKARALPGWLLVAAVPEAAFQVWALVASGGGRLMTVVVVGVHVFVFGVVALYLFWRGDFVTMLGFRLVYYGVWHLGWPALRSAVLG